MQSRVVELIPQLVDEGFVEELLVVNDDLNNAFIRYERCVVYEYQTSMQLFIYVCINNCMQSYKILCFRFERLNKAQASEATNTQQVRHYTL